MKNIIVGTLTLIIFALMAYTAKQGRAFHGGEAGHVIENMATIQKNKMQNSVAKSDDSKIEQDKLKALREKAGNAGAFKVSQLFKSKCSSCHGVNGSGEQNGKKLMGPKLFGKSAKQVYKNLTDFKAGRKENLVMKGLLLKLDEKQMRKLADEIGEFPARLEALNK